MKFSTTVYFFSVWKIVPEYSAFLWCSVLWETSGSSTWDLSIKVRVSRDKYYFIKGTKKLKNFSLTCLHLRISLKFLKYRGAYHLIVWYISNGTS
jgi:hypothetical protein